MKRKTIKSYIFLILPTLFLASCGGDDNPSSSGQSSSAESVTLKEALENTKSNYQIGVQNDGGSFYTFGVYAPDFYYYAPSEGGYIKLDTDTEYLHAYSLTQIDSEDGSVDFNYDMDVYGRNAYAENYEIAYAYDFLDIIEKYVDDFSRISDDTYASSTYEIASDIRDFFTIKMLGYCNYFEIKISEDGRIEKFIPYEKSLSYDYSEAVLEFELKSFDKTTFSGYKNWVKKGKKVVERIYDLKAGDAKSDNVYHALYEDEEMTVKGIVSSFDYEGNYYIATQDDSLGNVAIRVRPSGNKPAILDEIEVKGTIKCDGYVPYISDATYTYISKAEYYPYFDEEQIVDGYGGGYYAYYFFASYPIYGDSIYSTYAYINEMPEEIKEDEDTTVELIFPQRTENLKPYRSELILPKEMSLAKREETLEQLKTFGVRGDEDVQEVSLEKFIIKFDAEYNYGIKLLFGDQSVLSKRLTPEEKIEKKFGLSSFPIPEGTSYSCYSFGGGTGMYIEDMYGKDTSTKREGIFYANTSVSDENLDLFIASLKEIGFSLVNGYKDYSGVAHLIYTNEDKIVVDYYTSEGYMGNTGNMFYMWIYQGDVLYYQTIEEKLTEEIPYFDADNDFVTLDELDSSFTYYALDNYAGNVFEKGNYLSCITLDVNDDCFASLRTAYREKGYSQYRVDGSLYSYSTRGSTHYVYAKAIEGTNEYIFVDMASYDTTDYTYAGHSSFQTRIEILIYKGTSPINVKYDSTLDGFVSALNESDGGGLSITLPEGCKVETYYMANTGESFVMYGYLYNMDSFVYSSDLTAALAAIENGLISSGYELSYTTEKGNLCYTKEGNKQYSYVSIIKNDRYIRLINSIPGYDF